MKKLFIIILSLFLLNSSVLGASSIVGINNKGYIIDESNQIIKKPIKVKSDYQAEIQPSPTIQPFGKYLQISCLENPRASYKTPYIPSYNIFFSERKIYPHSKQQYIDTWCTGEKNQHGMDCYNDKYSVTFVRARHWPYGVFKAPLKAKKHGKIPVLFLIVDNIEVDAEAMSEVKQWSQAYNLIILFGTIDTYIPISYVM